MGGHEESSSPLVVRQSPESAELTNGPQQQDQGCRLWAGGPLDSTASLVTASKLLFNVMNQIIKVEDFDITENEQDTKACEQILDKFLEFSSASMENAESSSTNTSNENNILDTAWEETFGDLFPDLDLEYC